MTNGGAERSATTNEIGRGVLIIFVFYVHSLYGYAERAPSADAVVLAWLQLKVLAPQVSLFFLLAGMTSAAIVARPLRVVMARSLMLLLLANASHVIGVLLETLLYPSYFPWSGAMPRLADPILSGTDYSTFVAWFFIVLAITRPLAWCFHRDRRMFLLSAVAIAAVGFGAGRVGLPDNLFEWRNLPVSVLLFLLGMRLRADAPVPRWMGLSGMGVAVAVGLLVTPGLFLRGPCLRCDLTFVAQPMVGEYGFLPAYLAQIAGGGVFLLWAAQRLVGTRSGAVARYFGRSSLMFLLLHGWVITTIYPAAMAWLPRQDALLLYPVILVANIVLHAALFRLLRPVLVVTVSVCTGAARFVVAGLSRRRA